MAGYAEQPNGWTCGPAALWNAIYSMHPARPWPPASRGIPLLARYARTTPERGTPVTRLAKAARAVGYRLKGGWTQTLRSPLLDILGRGNRALMVCDHDSSVTGTHWIVVVKYTDAFVYVVDSGRPPHLRRMRPSAFYERVILRDGPYAWGFRIYELAPMVRRGARKAAK